ncbi:MAG: biliverdin-producing heme oxygenase [Acidobacteriota bacterium]
MPKPPSSNETFAARIRRETAPEHEAIEGVVDLMRPDIDRAAYRGYLERALGFIEASDARVRQHLGAWLDLELRTHAPRLIADLRALGASDDEIAALPRAEDAFSDFDLQRTWGAAYVIEGSTLGGQLLRKHLASTLDGEPPLFAFLDPHGPQTGRRWREFRAALEAAAEREDPDRIVDGARETFARYRRWLAQPRLVPAAAEA